MEHSFAGNATVNDFQRQRADQQVKIEEGQDEFSRTYIFGDEDHTFGNPLRHILMQRTETDFCGYSVPHPVSNVLHTFLILFVNFLLFTTFAPTRSKSNVDVHIIPKHIV
jgi:DNA-directed RNA polymerase subunit L